ncbi:hypothetical protein BTA31_01325 [Bacillus haynesii]|uniref:Uncharacterized protein n=1 Tax=Bacillus haynesii TaxID=1925021 RepID=A0ABX3IAP2_9BACI|nr:hypothetical protein BTA31_01325 [Bacillus haynesii]
MYTCHDQISKVNHKIEGDSILFIWRIYLKINEIDQKSKIRISFITKNGSLIEQVVKNLQQQGIKECFK